MGRKLRYGWWCVLMGLLIVAIWKLFLPQGSTIEDTYPDKERLSRQIVVYVAGAVEKPGLVYLEVNARVDDALKQIRLLPEADLERLNPAEKLKDGQKVMVPFKVVVPQGTAPNLPAVGSNPVPTAGTSPYGERININTAGPEELDRLSGVGPAIAEKIIQYRAEHGPFSRAEDLKKVSGIGPKTYEKMASQITVGP